MRRGFEADDPPLPFVASSSAQDLPRDELREEPSDGDENDDKRKSPGAVMLDPTNRKYGEGMN